MALEIQGYLRRKIFLADYSCENSLQKDMAVTNVYCLAACMLAAFVITAVHSQPTEGNLYLLCKTSTLSNN